MTAEPRTEAMTWRAKSQPFERDYDSDLIAVLIELTSRAEMDREHSARVDIPAGLPRILLDARSFATIPVD